MSKIIQAQNDLLMKMKSLALQAQGKTNTQIETSNNENKGVKFGKVLLDQVNKINTTQIEANALSEKIAMGDNSVSLSQAMTQIVKSDLSFQFLVKARNRLLDAYKEIMNMTA